VKSLSAKGYREGAAATTSCRHGCERDKELLNRNSHEHREGRRDERDKALLISNPHESSDPRSPRSSQIHLRFVLSGIGLGHVVAAAEKYHPKGGLTVSGAMFALAAFTLATSYPMRDQSDNVFFEGYAKGILGSLPKDSLLLINYDQQWTSIR
jgi:hypothetical protein